VFVVLLVTGLVLFVAPVRAHGAVAVPAQDDPTTTSPTFGENPDAPGQHIIPRPNSGAEPEDAGDRGGALQLAVLVTLAVRESRRNRRQRAATSA
jgi:hypothetical protein